MSEARYDVIFSGKLVEGAAVDQVKANVARLFKVEVAKVERLFSGSPVVIKKGVDEATAKRYLLALKKAGAICEAKRLQQSAAPPQAPQGAPDGKQVAAQAESAEAGDPGAIELVSDPNKMSEAEVAAGEEGATRYVIKSPPASLGELRGTSVDEPGVVLVAPEEAPEPQVDISGIRMDEPGVVLVEPEEVPEPQVDISGLSLDAPGATLVEHEEPPPLEVDISDLTMDEPGVVIVEPEEVEAPDIDTSKLTLT